MGADLGLWSWNPKGMTLSDLVGWVVVRRRNGLPHANQLRIGGSRTAMHSIDVNVWHSWHRTFRTNLSVILDLGSEKYYREETLENNLRVTSHILK